MKIALPRIVESDPRFLRLATLERPQPKGDVREDANAREYKLRHKPTDKYSTTYNVTVVPLSSPTCEEYIRFMEKFNEILRGLNQSTADDKKILLEQLLGETEKTAFRSGFRDDGTFTDADFKNGLEALKASIFPRKAALLQKRLLQALRKPRVMKFRDYVARMMEINGFLIHFPWINGELTKPYPEDEMMWLVYQGLPSVYHKFMHDHGLDETKHIMDKFMDFVEDPCESNHKLNPPSKTTCPTRVLPTPTPKSSSWKIDQQVQQGEADGHKFKNKEMNAMVKKVLQEECSKPWSRTPARSSSVPVKRKRMDSSWKISNPVSRIN